MMKHNKRVAAALAAVAMAGSGFALAQQKSAADQVATAMSQIREAADQLAAEQAQRSATAERVEELVGELERTLRSHGASPDDAGES